MGGDSDNNDDNNTDSSQFDLKSAVLIFITIFVIIVGFFKFVIPALVPTTHAPSSVLEDSTGDYVYEDLFK